MMQRLSILTVVLWLCLDVSFGFPAIERPALTEDDSAASYLSRAVNDGAAFAVPEGVELTTGEGRQLKTTTVEDVKEIMADTVADNGTTSQSFILSYAGEVKRVEDIITVTAPNGKVYTFDLAKYPAIQDVTILEMTKSIIVNIRRIGKENKTQLQKFIDDLEAVRPVYVIEADSEAEPRSVPNDPLFDAMWHFRNPINVGIHANPEASWDRLSKLNLPKTPGRVAVIDELVDVSHNDLLPRFFTNTKEMENGEDTDLNGCIDDVHNCNYDTNSAEGNTLPTADNHGTHVTGIVGAMGNNQLGVAGLSKTGSLETVPIGVALSSKGAVSSVIRAINYAIDNNAQVSNNSYGFNQPVPSIKAALIVALKYKHLFVCAVENSYQRDGSAPGNKDYPAMYRLPNILTVTSINSDGQLSDFSGYGLDLVHLGAPGDMIMSTINYGKYGFMSGTSMSNAMVSAAAGQVSAAYPELTSPQLKRIMSQSVRKIPTLKEFVISGGMLDADRALLFGQCEDAFTKARTTCKAKASEADKAKYVSAGAEAAEGLALQCEGTAAVLECVHTELKKTNEQACYRRTCDIAEGQCEDLRSNYQIVNPNLPVMKLGRSCKYGRLVDNALVRIHIKSSEASSNKAAMLKVQEMLTKQVLQTNEEVVMDAVLATNIGYRVSAVINVYTK